jgi:hypothetical protein
MEWFCSDFSHSNQMTETKPNPDWKWGDEKTKENPQEPPSADDGKTFTNLSDVLDELDREDLEALEEVIKQEKS